ncbi:MAG: glutamine-synthetase adenylyltransferase [Bryobacteraceae bacterium]
MQRLLEGIEFRDRARALAGISQVLGSLPEDTQSKIGSLLTSCADPDTALHYLGRLYQDQPDAFLRLCGSATGLQYAVAVFCYSRFLSEEILQHPHWIEDVIASQSLYRVISTEDIASELDGFLGGDTHEPPPALSLAVFRRKRLLRILIRDVLGLATLSEITEEISNLADAILHVTYQRIRNSLVKRHGKPRNEAASRSNSECGFSVLALGKLGGRELNYSSDIDLMFLYSGNGYTDGEQRISNKEFFKKIANQYTELLSTYTAEGMCYRVDLRLRPDGRLGEVCISLEGAKSYYQSRAGDWELQMLIKARVAAGEPDSGRELLEFVQPKIYTSTLNFSAVEAMSLTRERISEKLAQKRGRSAELDVKLARGGIRDIEFLVQCLQRLHGGRSPWLRHAGTLLALLRLKDKDLLSKAEYSRLASAYQFLRTLEHRLQFQDDRQTHTLPSNSEELELLAGRMPQSQLGRAPSAEKLLRQLNSHLEEVQETYDRVIHSQQPLYYSSPPAPPRDDSREEERQPVAEVISSNLIRFLDQRAPGLAKVIAEGDLRRGFNSFEHFLEKIYVNPEHLGELNNNPVLARDVVELFEYSPHFAEQLIRYPELIEELAHVRDGTDSGYREMAGALDDSTSLRRFFRREMLRIQAASICLRVPVFTTLGRTSDLADAVINAVYRMAVSQVREAKPPSKPDYNPKDQLMIIALGRLGMREFDLGSDADLNFVLPDEDAAELQFWTRVAERTIDIITAYTGEGVMFAVDTRLRPNGREGALVQLVSSYKEYFAKSAEAWEGITYMKSRALTGDVSKATRFLHELQEVDWRRYGQGGRSRADLREMRARLEREQGDSHPLKAGPGGFYDIDFALMYLRLKTAGIFFKVLNTPERIDIIEKMGHLERADAGFLQDAATFYRAIDHGLRVYSGHAEGKLPNSEAHLSILSKLVYRWTPGKLHDQPLPDKLAEIQTKTRAYFKRLFG